MLISIKKLLHLPVFTESGVKLGHIYDVTLDIETRGIKEYLARQFLLGGYTYIIKPAQVVKITDEKMTVEDALLKEGGKAEVPSAVLYESAVN